jgi:hypothetical protein
MCMSFYLEKLLIVIFNKNRGSPVSILTIIGTKILYMKGIFSVVANTTLFPAESRPVLGPTHSHIHWLPGRGCLCNTHFEKSPP